MHKHMLLCWHVLIVLINHGRHGLRTKPFHEILALWHNPPKRTLFSVQKNGLTHRGMPGGHLQLFQLEFSSALISSCSVKAARCEEWLMGKIKFSNSLLWNWRTLCPSSPTKTCKKRSCFETSSKLLPLLMILMMVNLLALHDVSQRCPLSFPAIAKRPARDMRHKTRHQWHCCIVFKIAGNIQDQILMAYE